MTDRGGEASTDSELDHEYFRALEEAFIRLRGAPLLLSPADWKIARDWRRRGVPLELAVRVMEKIFRRQRDAEQRTGIRSLSYFRAAVDRSWSRIVELGGEAPGGGAKAGEGPGIDVGTRLERLAVALPSREVLREQGRSDPGSPAAVLALALEGLPEQLRNLSGDSRSVERELSRIDRAIMSRLRNGLSEPARAAVEAEVEQALRRVSERLSPDRRDQASALLVDRYLRDALDLPLLSLFSPEARSRSDDRD